MQFVASYMQVRQGKWHFWQEFSKGLMKLEEGHV